MLRPDIVVSIMLSFIYPYGLFLSSLASMVKMKSSSAITYFVEMADPFSQQAYGSPYTAGSNDSPYAPRPPSGPGSAQSIFDRYLLLLNINYNLLRREWRPRLYMGQAYPSVVNYD
jgi:hypothetical protein